MKMSLLLKHKVITKTIFMFNLNVYNLYFLYLFYIFIFFVTLMRMNALINDLLLN